MTSLRITCISQSGYTLLTSSHEHITHAGGHGWHWPVEHIIQAIDAKTHSFYVKDDRTGNTGWVGVVRPSGKRPHIRTYADGQWNDNLLSLGACAYRPAA